MSQWVELNVSNLWDAYAGRIVSLPLLFLSSGNAPRAIWAPPLCLMDQPLNRVSQNRTNATQLFPSGAGQLVQHRITFGSDTQFHLSPIFTRTRPPDQAPFFAPVHQLHHAVMVELHP